jgi:hypothetical protein
MFQGIFTKKLRKRYCLAFLQLLGEAWLNPKTEIKTAGLHQSFGHKRFGIIQPDRRGQGGNFSKVFLRQNLDTSGPFLFRFSG